MVKCQNVMVLFFYLQLILSHPLINEIYWSEEGCPHHFLIHILPLKLHTTLCILISTSSFTNFLPLCLPLSCDLQPLPHYVPLLPPLLHLHVFPHIPPLKLHPYISLLLSPSSCTRCIPPRLPLPHNLYPLLNYVPTLLPLLHIHFFHT